MTISRLLALRLPSHDGVAFSRCPGRDYSVCLCNPGEVIDTRYLVALTCPIAGL